MRIASGRASAVPFLSTLPARGATALPHPRHRPRFHFYPRSPRGERRLYHIPAIVHVSISIHAPREGSDDWFSGLFGGAKISIHAPREGSDLTNVPPSPMRFMISIHAPREGSDLTNVPPSPMRFMISIHAPREGSDHHPPVPYRG